MLIVSSATASTLLTKYRLLTFINNKMFCRNEAVCSLRQLNKANTELTTWYIISEAGSSQFSDKEITGDDVSDDRRGIVCDAEQVLMMMMTKMMMKMLMILMLSRLEQQELDCQTGSGTVPVSVYCELLACYLASDTPDLTQVMMMMMMMMMMIMTTSPRPSSSCRESPSVSRNRRRGRSSPSCGRSGRTCGHGTRRRWDICTLYYNI